MDLELIKNILIFGIGASIFSTAIIQKIKEQLKSKKWLFILSMITSIVTGFLFSISFTDLNIFNSLWVAVITWVGADTIYKQVEDKFNTFKSFSSIDVAEDIEREDLNE